MSEKMHYFKAVVGRACPRYGSDTFIGCRRGPKGFVWAEGAVVAIPDKELAPNRKAYRSHLRDGDLKKASEAEYDQWLDKRRKDGEAVQAKAKEDKKVADEEAKKVADEEAKKADDEEAKEAADTKAKKAADAKAKKAADAKAKKAAKKGAKATKESTDSTSVDERAVG